MTLLAPCGGASKMKPDDYKFIDFIEGDYTSQINKIYAKPNWVILAFFIYYESLTGKQSITIKEFCELLGYSYRYALAAISIGIEPLIFKDDSNILNKKTTYRLTDFGRRIANEVWENLNLLLKNRPGENLQEYVERIKKIRSLELESDAIDIEEEELKRIEENNRLAQIRKETLKAGIPKFPESPPGSDPIKINLENIEVK